MELGVDFNDSKAIEQKGYRREKGVVVDAGLHSLYVHMIRSSKHYLYIENQFFDGAQKTCCRSWISCWTDPDCAMQSLTSVMHGADIAALSCRNELMRLLQSICAGHVSASPYTQTHSRHRLKWWVRIAGSSFAWDDHQDIGANNLVPVEMALRIVRAIRYERGCGRRSKQSALQTDWPKFWQLTLTITPASCSCNSRPAHGQGMLAIASYHAKAEGLLGR